MTGRLIPSVGTARFNGPAGRTLRIVAEASSFNPGQGTPTVLTDGEEWYSADVVFDGTQSIAYAVNGYADETEARLDAERRIGA